MSKAFHGVINIWQKTWLFIRRTFSPLLFSCVTVPCVTVHYRLLLLSRLVLLLNQPHTSMHPILPLCVHQLKFLLVLKDKAFSPPLLSSALSASVTPPQSQTFPLYLYYHNIYQHSSIISNICISIINSCLSFCIFPLILNGHGSDIENKCNQVNNSITGCRFLVLQENVNNCGVFMLPIKVIYGSQTCIWTNTGPVSRDVRHFHQILATLTHIRHIYIDTV